MTKVTCQETRVPERLVVDWSTSRRVEIDQASSTRLSLMMIFSSTTSISQTHSLCAQSKACWSDSNDVTGSKARLKQAELTFAGSFIVGVVTLSLFLPRDGNEILKIAVPLTYFHCKFDFNIRLRPFIRSPELPERTVWLPL